MLEDSVLYKISGLLRRNATRSELRIETEQVRSTMNPHPAGQKEMNVPRDSHGQPVKGMQVCILINNLHNSVHTTI